MRKLTGSPEKIKQVATEDQFEQMKNQIAKDNNLKRCICGQLLAKFSSDNKTINIQKRKLDVIAEVGSVTIRCPQCDAVNHL